LRSFVGLMTIYDYIKAIRTCCRKSIPLNEITSKTISEILISAPLLFKNNSFQAIEAEDSVLQLCLLFMKNKYDYIPVIDPDNGNLISILGPLDVLHLLNYIAKSNESVFQISLEQLGIGTFQTPLVTANKSMVINDVLELIDYHQISSVPIVDEMNNHRLIGLYHKNDVTFIMKSSDPEQILFQLNHLRVEESLAMREQLLQSGDIMTNSQSLITCQRNDTIANVFNLMVLNRTNRIIIVDEVMRCVGIVSFRDILRYFFENFYNGNL
jgi:CBS domain-containing protein